MPRTNVGVSGFAAAILVGGALAGSQPAFAAGTNGPAHAMAMHGAPKYPADFSHFDYVNPNAPKGGTRTMQAVGTYDSFNPFIIRGNPATGVGLVYDTLTTQAADEPFSQYCLLCRTMEVPDDRSWVEYTLRDDATWHDGTPITADDVVFSFNILRESGAPFYRFYYSDVVAVEQRGPKTVRFDFGEAQNPELPLIVGQLTVLPKHYWDERDFESTTLEPPLGSGPYRIADFEPGRFIVYERVPDYWGRNHPTHVGHDNFDRMRFEYFRDRTVSREAFKAGDIDLWVENSSSQWATAFDTPAVKAGLIIRDEIPHERPQGMQGYVMNLRRPLFQDRRVREALGLAYDFEWLNQNISYGLLVRTDSYFDNSELGSSGLLADADLGEQEILEQYRGRIPDEVFTEAFVPPKTDGSGTRGIRGNLRKAKGLLEEAGWVVREGKLRHGETNEPFEFELLLSSPAQERSALPYARNLKRLGIEATVRVVDASQYRNRIDSFDFDLVTGIWGQSLSPGNEQREFWGSEAAARPGSRNLIGITDPVIDELVDLVITAPDRDTLVQRTRALDRVLLWGHYIVPHFHVGEDRIAYWDKFGRPDIVPLQGTQLQTWWIDLDKEGELAERRRALRRRAQ